MRPGVHVGQVMIWLWVLRSSRMFAFATPSMRSADVNSEFRTVMFFAPPRMTPPGMRSPSSMKPWSPVARSRPMVAVAPSCGRMVTALPTPVNVP